MSLSYVYRLPQRSRRAFYKSSSTFTILFSTILALIFITSAPVVAQSPQPVANPDLTPACGLDVILMLDESGSVGPAAQTVRDGARALLTGLADTGSRAALIEFNAQASAPLGAAYLPVTTGPNGTLSAGGDFDSYLTNGYNPTDATNWDGALGLAANINANHGAADLVIFFTDGNPNIYVTPEGNNQPGSATTALHEAIVTANLVKTQGSHIFVVGVGDVTEANLVLVSGADKYPDANLPFGQTDYTLVTFAEFITTLRTIAYNLCTPYLAVTKVVDEANGAGYQPQAGWAFTGTVQVTEVSQPATAFDWLLPAPGSAAQVGQSQAALTDGDGAIQWQWAPGTITDPQPWSSRLHLTEEARPNYEFVDASCLRRTLDPLNDFVETTFTLAALPTTIDYGPNDVVACTIRNARVALTVEKSALPATLPEPGGVVTYTYTVRNSGAVPLQLTALNDELLQNLQGQGTCLPTGSVLLAPGGLYQCMVATTLIGNAGDLFDYMVTATGLAETKVITATDNAIVIIEDVFPAAMVSKRARPSSLPEIGGPVLFTLTVTNLSAAEPVTLLTLRDNPYGDVTQLSTSIVATTCHVPQILAPAGNVNASYTCTFTANVTGNAGSYTDQITATLVDDEENEITPTAEATVTLTDVPSSLRVTKSADRVSVPEPGGNVIFTVLVENTSLVDQVTITRVVDSQVSGIEAYCTVTLPFTLAVGGSFSCTYQVQIQGNQGESYTNEVVAGGLDDDGKPVSDQDQVTVLISNLPSSLQVIKRADLTAVSEPGQLVRYTVIVRNTSPADVVTVTTVADTALTNVADFCQPSLALPLQPGAEIHCTYQLFVGGRVDDIVVNHFTANGIDDDMNLLTAADQEEVRIIDVPSSLQVTKVATPASVPETGGAVTFAITVRNTSAVDTVTVNQVHDSVFGDVSTTCAPMLPVQLPVDGVVVCQFTRTLSGDVGQPHVNIVTATGTDDEGIAVSGEGRATVSFTDVKPVLSITKVATPQRVLETGGTVTFTFRVANPGAEALTLLELIDNVFGDLNGQGSCITPQSLPAGGTYQCQFSTLIRGIYGTDHQNVVVAYGQDNEGNVVAATQQATVQLLDAAPDIVVTKQDQLVADNLNDPTSYVGIVSPGDTLAYIVVLHNRGNEAATNVVFEDTPDPNSQLIVGSVKSDKGVVRIGNALGETKVVIDIDRLAIDERVTIQFQILITEGTGDDTLINQAEILSVDPTRPGGSNLALSDDPDTPAPNDATITSVSIPPTGLGDEAEPPMPNAQQIRLFLPLVVH